MHSPNRFTLFFFILYLHLSVQILTNSNGMVTNEFGRISIADHYIHVSSALTLMDCIRHCLDFTKIYSEYPFEDCFAYNYDKLKETCELIHSKERFNVTIGFQSVWQAGIKY